MALGWAFFIEKPRRAHYAAATGDWYLYTSSEQRVTIAPRRQPIPFGKYLLLDRVNIGGMAEVWRAKTFGAGGFERLLAIKRILPNIAEDEEFITMFIDEAKITVQLSHANIAQVYELSHEANAYFIAMEYVSGKDLRAVFDRCRKKGEPAPIPLTCHVVSRCCEGLDYAHRAKDRQGREMNIVHRDVSPQNVLISYEGEIKVIDFGIAKAAGKATKTQAGILKGKFGYMSPEQIRGVPLDRRSDVFAMGVCLYEMLTGERLFVGESDFSVLEKVRKVEVLPPSHFNRRIPAPLERMVMRALAKDVEERYQYASDLGMDLQSFMYSTGARFGERELSLFMKSTFAEEYDKEKARLVEFTQMKAPESVVLANQLGMAAGPESAPVRLSAPPLSPLALVDAPVAGPSPLAESSPTPLAQPLPVPALSRPPPAPPPSGPRPPPALRANSMPRLSPVALVPARDEQQATARVASDGSVPGAGPPPNTVGVPPRLSVPPIEAWHQGDVPTDPGQPAHSAPRANPAPVTDTRFLSAPPQRPSRSAMPAAPPPPVDPFKTVSDVGAPAHVSQNKPTPKSPVRRNQPVMVIGLAAVVALLIIGLVAVVVNKPPVKGLVMIVVPDELAGRVRLNINGEDLFEPDGSLLKNWPQMRSVPVGKATIMLTAPGYLPLTKDLDITTSEPAMLSEPFQKKPDPAPLSPP